MCRTCSSQPGFPLVIAEPKGFAQLVLLDKLVDEGDRVNQFGHDPSIP
jgi:hypothetical protein